HVCHGALYNSVWMCALTEDWARYDVLSSRLRELDGDGPLGQFPRFIADTLRDRSDETRSRELKYLRRSLERDGTIQLIRLVIAYAIGLQDETFEIIEKATFTHMFDPHGRPPSGVGNPGVIFTRTAIHAMIRDIRFVGLCAKLGLCDYWVKTDRWPDCGDEVPYDFRSEVRRLAAR